MDESLAKIQVAETGRLLLTNQLVARTWGNFSARLDDTRFCITPSGLGYEHMAESDIVTVRLDDGSFSGTRKPSSEKGIHSAAYRIFPEVNFVIHTHQTFATALGLTDPEVLSVTAEEKERLGGIAWAEYGLPGTKTLKNAVQAAMRQGAQTILMAHHGAVICGTSRDDAIARAELLEDICRRSCRQPEFAASSEQDGLMERILGIYPDAALEASAPVQTWASLGLPLQAQLDDMAQMIGFSIPVAKNDRQLFALLSRKNSVFYPGLGAVVRGEDVEDTAALLVLTRKAAIAALHCRECKKDAQLRFFDRILMRCVYQMKYSKKKKG